jgi:general secretion pathway protein F/type IV pilus assembly protein PilC
MLYKYKGYEKNGNKVNSSIEANTLELAKLKLKQQKIIITKINKHSFNLFDNIFKKSKQTISPLTLSVISRDLSIYLDSGISLLNAIKLINARYKKDKKLSPFFQSIVTFLDEGKNLYTSLDMQKTINLPEFYLQSIKISEDGGILKGVLLELSIYLNEQYKLKKQISSAMTYPLFIILVSIAMVSFMLSFIVPKITSIFEQNGQALPDVTQVVITMGDFITNNYIFILITLFLVIFSFSLMLKKSYKFKRNIDTFMLKVPFIGSIIEINELARFSYMNAILIKSGVPVVQSFQMGANILNNLILKELFLDASSKVVEGEKLSKILDNSKIYTVDIAFIQAIAIGEETSQLNRVLNNLAELYSTTNKDKIATFLSLLEPMLMLIVGITIGFIMIAMLLPIFSMSI